MIDSKTRSNQFELISHFVFYEKPSDYPNKVVVRRWDGLTPVEEPQCIVDTIREARDHILAHNTGFSGMGGYSNTGRSNKDDKVIIEVWI